jgi:flavin reductase (DIM6/NTAB) family NADH-FMN oxidoreductase RutF
MSVGAMRMGEKSHAVSPADFRAACGLFPSGVTVVTRRSPDGGAYGMTVSSFTSVSLHPPLILVCIDKRAGLVLQLGHPEYFAVNILSEEQQDLAVRFSAFPEKKRFDGLRWSEGWRGVPLIDGVVASLACSKEEAIEAGDHYVLVGRVKEIRQHPGRALVWCESRYHCLPTPPDSTRD